MCKTGWYLSHLRAIVPRLHLGRIEERQVDGDFWLWALFPAACDARSRKVNLVLGGIMQVWTLHYLSVGKGYSSTWQVSGGGGICECSGGGHLQI